MKQLIDLTGEEARLHFLKGSSYFNGDFPKYISFKPILEQVALVLSKKSYSDFGTKPQHYPSVNYQLVSNKDGRFAWRPYELMHPAIYVSLVNAICDHNNWKHITDRLTAFGSGAVECCSSPVLSDNIQSDKAEQVRNWWQRIEQRSLVYSLEYTHILHTDVTDCYGSLYTHSIAWALHGHDEAKKNKGDSSMIGNKIDSHLQASRYGQTNGICQGSVLMDFVAELVLGYVDQQITDELGTASDFKILRYRDDYRIFTNSDERAEKILKTLSDKLRIVGMKLGASKTQVNTNVIEGSIKPDKLSGIDLQDLGDANAKTIQKQLLRLHSFGKKFRNSGALRRLTGEFQSKICNQTGKPDDLDVQVAIAADIAAVSPLVFPAVAGILSYLISLAETDEKRKLWCLVHKKMRKIPHNGYLEVWMQRVTKPKKVGISFNSTEPICRIVDGEDIELWNNSWITSGNLKKALSVKSIIVQAAEDIDEVMQPKEIELFKQNAWY